MHETHALLNRVSTAMRQLDDLADDTPPPRWDWSIVAVEKTGRISLPCPARAALGLSGASAAFAGICHATCLVLSPGDPGRRNVFRADARGRLQVPVWLRRDDPDVLLVGALVDEGVVVIARTGVLDAVGDSLLVGEAR